MTTAALRLLGGGLLVLGGAMLGRMRCAELERRKHCLRGIAAALGRLQGELEALQSPLGELFPRLSDCPFFGLVSAGFGDGPLEELWRRAAEAQPLSAEERAALAALGPVLGRCGVQRQCAEIALARRRLSESADAAEREIAERARRFPILGAALGAIAAVVLL